MQTFPLELFYTVLSELEEKDLASPHSQPIYHRTVGDLALVSRSLRVIAHQQLFRNIRFEISHSKRELIKIRLENLLEILEHNERIPSYIKSFSCNGRLTTQTGCELLPTLSSLFLRLESLENILFVETPITLQMIEHIYALKRLRCVTMVDHKTDRGQSQYLLSSPIPPITHLSISLEEDEVHPAVIKLVAASKLQNLKVGGPCPAQMLHSINESYSNNFLSLSSLTIREWKTPTMSFFDIASLFPNLTFLHLATQRTSPPDQIDLDVLALKHLQHFEGFPAWAVAIVPGRPIERLTLNCWCLESARESLSTEMLEGQSSSLLLVLLEYLHPCLAGW